MVKNYSIPESELFRLLECCANQNNCLDYDNSSVKNSCKCYSKYCEKLTKQLIPNK